MIISTSPRPSFIHTAQSVAAYAYAKTERDLSKQHRHHRSCRVRTIVVNTRYDHFRRYLFHKLLQLREAAMLTVRNLIPENMYHDFELQCTPQRLGDGGWWNHLTLLLYPVVTFFLESSSWTYQMSSQLERMQL